MVSSRIFLYLTTSDNGNYIASVLIVQYDSSFLCLCQGGSLLLSPVSRGNFPRCPFLVGIEGCLLSDFTFVCPTEILAFNDALPQFKELNTTVLSMHIGYPERIHVGLTGNFRRLN